MMVTDPKKDRVARWIAGDITLSSNPGEALKRWRELFGMSQSSLAQLLDISPSVISDYEAGRRRSPGAATLKRVVGAFLKFDEQAGGKITHAFMRMFGAELPPDIVLDIREFKEPVDGKALCKMVEGEIVNDKRLLNRKLFGYTVIDSYKAVLGLSTEEFKRLYGMTTERILVFTGVTTGRSPMVAIKVIGITPGMVILHGELKQVDLLGIKIAELLHVPLVLSHAASVNDLLDNLRKCSA